MDAAEHCASQLPLWLDRIFHQVYRVVYQQTKGGATSFLVTSSVWLLDFDMMAVALTATMDSENESQGSREEEGKTD